MVAAATSIVSAAAEICAAATSIVSAAAEICIGGFFHRLRRRRRCRSNMCGGYFHRLRRRRCHFLSEAANSSVTAAVAAAV